MRITGGLMLLAMLFVPQACVAAGASDWPACPSPSADNYYFAAGTLSLSAKDSDALERHWYSEQLLAMGEPSLSCGQPGNVYRFTWLRSFHHPVVVRVTDFGDHTVVQASELAGKGGYKPGKVLRRMEKTLSADQFGELKSCFSEGHFFQMPTVPKATGDSIELDGAQWIVEVVDDGKYHLVVRSSPESGPIRELGTRLLALTGWNFGEVY